MDSITFYKITPDPFQSQVLFQLIVTNAPPDHGCYQHHLIYKFEVIVTYYITPVVLNMGKVTETNNSPLHLTISEICKL
jgi:hypothetical protein